MMIYEAKLVPHPRVNRQWDPVRGRGYVPELEQEVVNGYALFPIHPLEALQRERRERTRNSWNLGVWGAGQRDLREERAKAWEYEKVAMRMLRDGQVRDGR